MHQPYKSYTGAQIKFSVIGLVGVLCKTVMGILKFHLMSAILLGEPKYGPGSKHHWKAGSARYLAFYKALLDEPLINNRIEMVRARGDSSSPRNQ